MIGPLQRLYLEMQCTLFPDLPKTASEEMISDLTSLYFAENKLVIERIACNWTATRMDLKSLRESLQTICNSLGSKSDQDLSEIILTEFNKRILEEAAQPSTVRQALAAKFGLHTDSAFLTNVQAMAMRSFQTTVASEVSQIYPQRLAAVLAEILKNAESSKS